MDKSSKRRLTGDLRTFSGPRLSMLLAGKTIGEVYRNDELLVIRCQDGSEIRVAWVDEASGRPVKGRPAIAFHGRNVVPRSGGILVGTASGKR
jgi:hypothetical protein